MDPGNMPQIATEVREIGMLHRCLDDWCATNRREEADSQLISKTVVVKMDTKGHIPFMVESAKEFLQKYLTLWLVVHL